VPTRAFAAWKQLSLLLFINIILFPSVCRARTYDIYRSDYPKGAFCAVIAGACASDNDQESAYFQNPASLTAGPPDFSFDGDFDQSSNIEPGMKGTNEVTESSYMGGLAVVGKKWGMGLAFDGRKDTVKSNTTISDQNDVARNVLLTSSASTWFFHVPFAWRVSQSTSLGITLTGMYFTENFAASTGETSHTQRLNSLPHISLTVGGIFSSSKFFRVGTWLRTPLLDYNKLDIQFRSFGYTLDYSENLALYYPWIWATGLSVMPWQDEKTLLVDVDVVGSTDRGYLLSYDSFSAAVNDTRLKAKGNTIAFEPRLGYRSPWRRRSKGSYLFGTFLEPARTAGVDSRLHLTGGLAYNVGNFLEFLAGVDAAKGFFKFYLSFR
jgi:hypothetical protein